MVDLETQIGRSVDANSDGHKRNSERALILRCDVSQRDQRAHRSPKPDRVEKFARELDFEDSPVVQPVGERAQQQAHHHHGEVRQGRQQSILLDVEVQNGLHVGRNFRQDGPEAPVVRRVNDDQSDGRWRCEDRLPWCCDGLKRFKI